MSGAESEALKAERLKAWDGNRTIDVLGQVYTERCRQELKWGQQNHPNGTGRNHVYLPVNILSDVELAEFMRAKCKANTPETDNYRDILEEEVYEAFAESDDMTLRKELVQVAAVAVAWIECIDRRHPKVDVIEETEAAIAAGILELP